MKYFVFISFLFLCIYYKVSLADQPCAARQIINESVVCVCNASYCDDIIRTPPEDDNLVIYTSSLTGLRFEKSFATWDKCNLDTESRGDISIEVDTKTQFQKIQGFGAALTDAAAINWQSLCPELQAYLINSYFGADGLEYNMVRTPIGGADFSTHPYAYNELPWDDANLTNFSLTSEDILYKIPMFEAVFNAAVAPVHIVATTWSPPVWMKTNEEYGGHSLLKPEYYQTYADYHLKFLDLYNSSGIPIWGITTTNEPINGIFSLAKFNSLGWTIPEMGKYIEHNLGPTIRNSRHRNVKIITGDDQRLTIPFWFNLLLDYYPKAMDYIDGLAVHYYTDKFVTPTIFELVTKNHPDKFILATEACEGTFPWEKSKVLLGSWDRAKSYIIDIFQDLNYNLVGWIDWNMCLDTKGGPNWASNFVDSPIIVDKERQEFIKQPMFYAMGHFSKFIPRDSTRIKVTERNSFLRASLHHVAFVTTRQTIVVVLYNNGCARSMTLKYQNRQATLHLEAHSLLTVEFSYSN